jgi:hypothetical protein
MTLDYDIDDRVKSSKGFGLAAMEAPPSAWTPDLLKVVARDIASLTALARVEELRPKLAASTWVELRRAIRQFGQAFPADIDQHRELPPERWSIEWLCLEIEAIADLAGRRDSGAKALHEVGPQVGGALNRLALGLMLKEVDHVD